MRSVVHVSLMVVALGVAVGVPGACGSNNGGVEPSQAAPTPSGSIEQGRAIYSTECSACHGENGQGQVDWHITNPDGTFPAPPLNGDGHAWHHSDGLLYLIVNEGGATQESPAVPSFKSAMPPFDDRLSHQEIIDAITYIKSLWGDKEARGVVKRESQAHVSKEDPFPSVN